MQRKMYEKNNNNNMKHLLFLNNIGWSLDVNNPKQDLNSPFKIALDH